MFYAANRLELGSVSMATRVAVTRGARIHVAQRVGLRSDTARQPATQSAARDHTVLWILLEGAATIEHDGTTTELSAPCAIKVPESWLEGAKGQRSARFQSWGASYASIQVCYRAPCSGLEVPPLEEEWGPMLATLHRGILEAEAEASTELLHALLWKLVAMGLVPSEAALETDTRIYEDATTQRVWAAMQRRFSVLDVNPSLKAIAADVDLSVRHAHRIMTALFQSCMLPPGGFREATVNLRLSFASLMLSEPKISVGSVAKIAGYTHPETLAAAFRRSRLPSPLAVRGAYEADTAPPSSRPRAVFSEATPCDGADDDEGDMPRSAGPACSSEGATRAFVPDASGSLVFGRMCLRPRAMHSYS